MRGNRRFLGSASAALALAFGAAQCTPLAASEVAPTAPPAAHEVAGSLSIVDVKTESSQ